MSVAPAIGIDLGTTFSSAAVYRNGKAEVIPDKEGHRLIPSFIFYHPESLEVLVGNSAEEKAFEYRENVLFDQKRLIGRKYYDVYVQDKIKNNPDYQCKIVQGEEDKAEVELIHDGLRVCKSPEQACSEILKYLRECASEYLGADVTEAVISIPAYFSNAQRKATRAAAELSGLKVLKLITEPVAGAIHYAQEKLKTRATLLVYDFGGGTLDVSIINVHENTFEVKSVEGNTFLGGRNFDEILMAHFRDDMVQSFGEQSIERLLHRLRKNCIKMKRKLSTLESYYIPIEYHTEKQSMQHKLALSRLKFEELILPLLTESLAVVDKCLSEAGLTKQDISDVVLVGGTTRLPKVREMLRSYFNVKNLRTDLNPDEAVALGAAVQAALFKNNFVELEKYKITEVSPLSIGMCVGENLMKFVIKKNTPLPFRSNPIKLATRTNSQASCWFKIFEGERKNCYYNNLLGSFTIENIPKGKAGDIKFEAIFSLNEDGILEVEAFETTTGEKNKLIVTVGEYRLCENKIKSIIDDAANNLKYDNIFEVFSLYKQKVQRQCYHILYYLNVIPLETEREFIEKRCNAFIRSMGNLTYTKIDSLKEQYTNFRIAVNPIVQKWKIDVDLFEDS